MVNIPIKNIGQGLAKEILVEIDWNMNWKEYLATIIKELEMHNVLIDCQISDKSYWVNADKSSGILIGGNYTFNKTEKYNFDYLLPTKDNDVEINIELPSFITVIIQLSILLIECSSHDKQFLLLNKLKESLKIGSFCET